MKDDFLSSSTAWMRAVVALGSIALVLVAATGCRADTNVPRTSVPLKIDVPEGIRSGLWPVTVGVPFPAGVLAANAGVSVLRNGRPISVQATPLAFWEREKTSVRWLLLDFAVDAATARNERYELIVNARPIPSSSANSTLKLSRSNDALLIETGAASFRLRTRQRLAIESVQVGKQQLVTAQRPAVFSIANQNGKRFYASGDETDGGFIIEDKGPQRIGLKSEGWYVADDGEKFCKHVIRLEFFANQSLMRVFHTLIFTGTSESAQISDIAFEIPLQSATASTPAFGTDAEDFSKEIRLPGERHALLIQDYETRWDLKWQLKKGVNSEVVQTGARSGGWAQLWGAQSGVSVAMRDAWQNYPNEFEVSDNALITHFWPRHGRMLDFRTKAILEPYGEEGIAVIDKFFKSRPKPYSKSIFDVYNNAMGVAKTHELWIDFQAGARVPARTTQLAVQANTPVLASSDPEWNAASGVMGPMAAKSVKADPAVEEMLDAMFDRYRYWQSHYADYGFLDFGEIHCSARNDEFSHPVKGGRIAHLWRYWDSAHYGFPNALWVQYFRSGERKYLQFAEQNSRHVMDIDRCHFGNDKERIKGTHYYCDWSIIPWGGDRPEYAMLADYNRLEFMLYYYYLRGYRRGLDVMKEWGEAMARFHNDKNVTFPLRMLPKHVIQHSRHFGPNLGNLLELYRATWDERYLKMAQDYAQAIIELSQIDNPAPDVQRYDDTLRWSWEQFLDYARFSGDEKFKRAVVAMARASADRGGDYSWGDTAVAYALTGEEQYRAEGWARLAKLRSAMNLSDKANERGTAGQWASGRYPFALRTIPFFLGATREEKPQSTQQAEYSLRHNSSLHLAGPRLSPLYVQPDKQRNADLLIRVGWGQKATLRAPDGRVLREMETPAGQYRTHQITIEPQNNVSGANLKMEFELHPTRGPGEYEDRGNIEVLSVRGAKMVAGPSTPDGVFNVFAPRLYFWVPENLEQVAIEVDTAKTWALYGWHPQVHLYAPDGTKVAAGTGPGKFVLKSTVTPQQRGKLWSLGPFGRVEAPDVNATWHKPPRDPAAHFPAWFKLPAECPQFVAPRADLFFIPTEQDNAN